MPGSASGDNSRRRLTRNRQQELPTVTRYDHSARLAVLEAHGEVSREDAVSQFRGLCTKLANLYRLHPVAPYGVLLDTRRAATIPTPEDILRVLDEICGCGTRLPPLRWAMLATEPIAGWAVSSAPTPTGEALNFERSRRSRAPMPGYRARDHIRL